MINLSPAITQIISPLLVNFLWQGAAIGILFLMARLLFKNHQASLRHAVGCVAMFMLLLAPALVPLFPVTPVSRTLETKNCPVVASVSLDLTPQVEKFVVRCPDGPSTQKASTPIPPVITPSVSWFENKPWQKWMVLTWYIGSGLFGLRLFGGWLVALALVKRSMPILDPDLKRRMEALKQRFGIRFSVDFKQSNSVHGPSMIGCMRPTVIIPTRNLAEMNPTQLDFVIGHELAHIRRNDYLMNLFQSILEALFFFHPATWFISREVRRERENCCDDEVVQTLKDRKGYILALVSVEQLRGIRSPALGMNGGPFARRIERLVKFKNSEPGQNHGRILSLCTTICLAALLAGSRAFTPAIQAALPAVKTIQPANSMSTARMKSQSVVTSPSMVKVSGEASCEVFRGQGFNWEVASDPSVEVRLHSVERYFEHGVEVRRSISTLTNGFQIEPQFDATGHRTNNLLKATAAVQRMGSIVRQGWGVASEAMLMQSRSTVPGDKDSLAGTTVTIQVRHDGEFVIGTDKATSVMETIWRKNREVIRIDSLAMSIRPIDRPAGSTGDRPPETLEPLPSSLERLYLNDRESISFEKWRDHP